MNADRLFAVYDRVADAPGAVGRLRQFVLDLAVRGKLVEQDPAGEPASELLKRIAVDKARLVEAGTVRRSRKLPHGDTVCRFGLPASWVWSAIESVAHIEMGQSPRSEHYNRVGNGLAFFQGKADFGPRHPTPRYWCTKPTKIAEPNDILLSIRAPVGPTNVADQRCCIGRGLAALRPLEGLDREFMLLALKAFESDLASLGFGTTFVAITKKQLTRYGFPLPPLAEQHRIVAKVDQLMALCDRLEDTCAARRDTRDRLTKASHARLSDTETDAPTFRSHARFSVNSLPALTARAHQVKHLRQTILNLAVRGKLVEQDPADEPASELLKRIAAEKALLLKARKIRRRKRRESLSPPEPIFGLPSGWAAARLSDVMIELQTGPFGSSLHQSDYETGGTPVVNPASIRNGTIVPVTKMAVGKDTLERLVTFKLRTGDIVMGRRGKMGRCAVVGEREDGWLCGTGSLILRLSDSVCSGYLAMLIGSPEVREYLRNSSVGTTMRNLNQSILLAMSMRLPPLAEQHRIVAKVDELIAVCDRLEGRLCATDGTRNRLLESLLQVTLAPSVDEAATARAIRA